MIITIIIKVILTIPIKRINITRLKVSRSYRGPRRIFWDCRVWNARCSFTAWGLRRPNGLCFKRFRKIIASFGFEWGLGGMRASESFRILGLVSIFGPELQRFVKVEGGDIPRLGLSRRCGFR